MIKCPKCGSEEFLYMQRVTQYHTIDKINEADIELLALVSEYNHSDEGEYALQCDGCHVEYKSFAEYHKAAEICVTECPICNQAFADEDGQRNGSEARDHIEDHGHCHDCKVAWQHGYLRRNTRPNEG